MTDSSNTTPAVPEVETWRAVIIPFEASRDYANPFLDLEVWATFTGPSGRVIRREAYWDGGRTWRVAFAPTETGTWRYALEASADSGLDGASGVIEAVPYAGDLAIYRHGFLQVSQNGRYLEHADGTPFFWLGDTHWEFAFRERWDESNHSEMDSMFRGMIDRRAAQGYTVYQTNLRSDFGSGKEKYWTEDQEGRPLPNVEFYQQELDRRMAYLADAGLVNALGQAWAGSVAGEDGIEHQQRLARYIVARYGALPVVWTLAGEVAGYNPAQRDELIAGWREVAREYERRDGYGTLQTAHYTNERPFADYYQDEDWFDFTLNQAGHGDYLITAADYIDYLALHGDKPFIEGEALYEYCSTLEEMGTRLCTDDMLRRVAYLSIQLGGCGYTYGAQGIWDVIWEKPETPDPFMEVFNRFCITWAQAIDGPGGEQMGFMRRFYEENRFWELAPYETAGASGNLFAKKAPVVSATGDLSRIVAYYSDTARKPFTVDGLDASAAYTMRWFDPRLGTYCTGEEVTSEQGSLVLPAKPGTGDWLLVLERSR